VNREPYKYNSLKTFDGLRPHQGRITDLLQGNQLSEHLGLDNINPQHDRFIIRANDGMLQHLMTILDQKGFSKFTSRTQGQYFIEQAFIEK
jgi:ferredoxin--NADP+ reductase